MKRNNAQNSSAKKKLIPAVAMFTASAVMLSTATYAWFTMNRDVQVDGLQMTATTSSSLEISLGELDTVATPTKDSATWTKKIAVSDFYKTIGKLKPASSADGNTVYKIADESNIYAGGTKVTSTADIASVTQGDSATLTPGKATTDKKLEQTDTNTGYFVDVPMWIRSSNKAESKVYCTVTIEDGNSNTDDGEELMKAVRVAVIPVNKGSEATDLTGSNAMTKDSATALTKNSETAGTTTIFGLDKVTYNTNKVLSKTGTYADALGDTNVVTANNADATRKTATRTSVFTLPAATDEVYGVESFIVRVWLEGESTSCNDLTADQDWNINFDFSLDETAAQAGE